MRKTKNNRVKLLISIIDRKDDARYSEIVNDTTVAVSFSGIGHGTARSSYMSYFGFDEVEKRVAFSLFPERVERSLLANLNKGLRLFLPGRGIAFTVPLSGISNLVEGAVLAGVDKNEKQDARASSNKKEKKTMHELVIAVINKDFTDVAIDAARDAGATGATVFHTKSANNAKFEQLIGTSLSQETDSVFFLTTTEYKSKIMEAIRDSAGLKTDGGAVIFSLPVDTMVGIGKFEDDAED
jgi:hypothetical protein